MTTNVSKIENVFNALVNNGEELTAKQIASRYGISNPHDAIYQLRMGGYSIYLNRKKNSKGEVTHKYRHGTPSRKLIAAGYKALAAGIV